MRTNNQKFAVSVEKLKMIDPVEKRIKSENSLIERSNRGPVTISMLIGDLGRLGVKKGMTIIVHSSLSSIGWVCGGASAFIIALQKTVTGEGTIIMPTFTGENSDPAGWGSPAVSEEWIRIIRDEMPPFNENLTPTKKTMGLIAECFRKGENVFRSYHPRASFAAWGKLGKELTQNCPYDFPFGTNSPMGRSYEHDAYLLLVGVTFRKVSSWYLSAYLSQKDPNCTSLKLETCSSVVIENGERKWVKYKDYERYADDFIEIGEDYCKTKRISRGSIGHAVSILTSQDEAVDFAKDWMVKNR